MLAFCALLVPAAARAASAQGRERGGKEIVEAVCANCHTTGVDGAPRIGDRKAWAQLTSQSLTSLAEAALKGVRRMPPHGGNPDLTDTEIGRAIAYMVNQSGGDWIEPVSKFDSVVERSGAEVVQAYCARCHQSGAAGAPRIGDRVAWIPRVKQGFELLVRSAIKGHGAMPSRGDATNLTDSEIRAAIAYMVSTDSATTTRSPRELIGAPTRNGYGIDAAQEYASLVTWLRSFWTRIWGNPKPGS